MVRVVARARALDAVEREAEEETWTGPARAADRQRHAGPVLAAFAARPAEQRPRAPPKSAVGKAVTDTPNRWPPLGVHRTDGGRTIDNAPAEQAIRPPVVRRENWLRVSGDGGLRPTAVLPSVAASVRRHGLNPWGHLRHVPAEVPAPTVWADVTDLLPDVRARSQLASAGSGG